MKCRCPQPSIDINADGPAILWVNGMHTIDNDAMKIQMALQLKYNQKIMRIENNTHFIPIGDGIQALFHEMGSIDIVSVRTAQAMRRAIEQKGEVYIIAHSQGTMIVKQALLLLTPAERSAVYFQGFGGEAFISVMEDGLAEARNVRYSEDYVPWLSEDVKNNFIKYWTNLTNQEKTIIIENWFPELRNDWIDCLNGKNGDVHQFDERYINDVVEQWKN